ncbi:MAG: tRNA 2-thiouridine(34) synthase MnmA [Candidatus Pacearchaeota archaeon]
MINKKIRVIVSMSGGVDSSVAALLMKRKGYDVLGCFMKNWSDSKTDSSSCKWKEEREMAIKIASKLGIPLITLDFEKEYKRKVVDEMFNSYRKGMTPNPDIDCNEKIKFPLLIKTAKNLGADYVVTGHYARIKKTEKGYELYRAKDETKDQSYFLYRLTQKELKYILFPIGEFTKKKVREIARKNGFENFNRKGTVGICFIGKINLKKFLQKRIKQKIGKIFDPDGRVIGYHDGVYYYTIGQRIGPRFGIDIDRGKGKEVKRWYVAAKNVRKNEIIAAPEGHKILYKNKVLIKDPNWILGVPSKNNKTRVFSRIRHVGELLPSTLYYKNVKNCFEVILDKAITGISEGQAIVLYEGKKVLGGGVIKFDEGFD